MSAKLVVTLLATSLLTVGCVAYTDDPYYRGGYGYHDHDDDRYDHNDGRRYS
ncbi:putative lipoprotein [Acinetobacter baumannii 1051830]|nr:putative lipoprotein [Acinetobacter baumannii 1051830]